VWYPQDYEYDDDDKSLPNTPPIPGLERHPPFEYDDDKFADEVMLVPELSTISERTEVSESVASTRRNKLSSYASSRKTSSGSPLPHLKEAVD
jgi:hypothetical protein